MPRVSPPRSTTRSNPAPAGATTRQIRYGVAMSLDGYIAGPAGEYDWIVRDPDVDFAAIFSRFDAFVMGRKTFELTGGGGMLKGSTVVVFSTTLKQADHPGTTIVSGPLAPAIDALKRAPGKDIWLFGGGVFFRSMLEARLVDGIDVAVIPVLVGGGVPFLPPPAPRVSLTLTNHRLYPKTGIVWLQYDLRYD